MSGERVRGASAAVLLASLVVATATGCASATKSLAKQAAAAAPHTAVPSAVDETLKAAEDPHTRERLERVVATPEMQKTMQDVGGAIARGAVAGATRAVRATMATELRRGLDPEESRAIEAAVAGVTDDAARTAVRSAADEIPVTLAPAVRHAMATELRSPELRDAIADTAAAVAREDLARLRRPLILVLGIVVAVLAATVVVLAVALRSARRGMGRPARAT